LRCTDASSSDSIELMRLNRCIQLITMVAAALLTSSCATIFNFGTPKLNIVTVPPGAKIDIGDGLATCTSPCKIAVPVQKSLPLTATLENYPTYHGTVNRMIAISFYFNGGLGLYGLIGAAIDYATNSIWKWKSLAPIKLAAEDQPKPEPIPVVEAPPKNAATAAPARAAQPVSDLPTSTAPKEAKTNLDPGSRRTKYPEALVKRRIEWFFGPQSDTALGQHTECVYLIFERHEGGATLSLDDVVKMANGEKTGRCKFED
jgi:hypothetical protein